jgi:hypothetical protein
LLGLFIDPENGGYKFLRNIDLTFNGLYDIILEKLGLFGVPVCSKCLKLMAGKMTGRIDR